MTNPSPNFSWAELDPDGRAGPEARLELRYGALHVLEPLRKVVGPIRVTRAYTVGDPKTSQHHRGQAADLKPLDATKLELWAAVRDLSMRGVIPLDQGIVYELSVADNTDHVHVSWRRSGTPRGELRARTAPERRHLFAAGYPLWSDYHGPLKPGRKLTTSPALVPPEDPPASPEPKLARTGPTEASVALPPRLKAVVQDQLKEGGAALRELGRAQYDGAIDDTEFSELERGLWSKVVDGIEWLLDRATPFNGTLETVSDQAIDALALQMKEAGPSIVGRAGRWFRSLGAKNPRRLIALIDDILEADAEDGVPGNLQRRVLYRACRRLVRNHPEAAKSNSIRFEGNQLFIDDEAYGTPPRGFDAP